jgi:hypothetical protein
VVGSINIIKGPPKSTYLNLATESDHLFNSVTSVSHGAAFGNFYYMLSASYDKMNGYTVSKKLNGKTREDWLLKLSRYDLYGFDLHSVYNADTITGARSSAPYYLDDTGTWDHTSHEKYKTNGKAGYRITKNLEAGLIAFYNKSKMENSVYNTDEYSVYRYNTTTEVREWHSPYGYSSYILRNVSSRWPVYDDYALSPYIDYKNKNFELKANAYFYEQYNKYASYIDPKEIEPSQVVGEENMTWSIWTSRTYGFNIYPSYKLNKNHKLSFGISYYVGTHIEEKQMYDSKAIFVKSYYGAGKYKDITIAAQYLTLAIEDEIHLSRDTELSIGISYDAQKLMDNKKKEDKTGSTNMIDQHTAVTDAVLWGTQDSFNPVIGIVSQLTEKWKLRGSASYKTAFPTLQAYRSTWSFFQETADPGSYYQKLKSEKSINGNLGAEISFFDKQFTLGCDYFFSMYFDKMVRYYQTKIDDYVYRNMDFSALHGAETTLNWAPYDLFNFADISIGFTHTYIYARNLTKVHYSTINRGKYFEKLPEHKFTLDFKLYFKSDTSVFIFGYFEYNQIQYAMRSRPESDPAQRYKFTTDCFAPVKLNNPLMLDAKISQKFLYHYEVYLLCKNIFDDYLPDPFNPGPGRTFYLGLKANY